MIAGVITGKHVLRNGACIVREFGLRPFLRCLLALCSGRRATFLELIWKSA